jgi:hypothetical protein
MNTPDKKDSGKLKHSIFDALDLANERIVEAAKLLVFADGEGEFHIAQHTLENAVHSELDLEQIAEELSKMYSKVELETAVEEAHQAIAKRTGKSRKHNKKNDGRELPQAA